MIQRLFILMITFLREIPDPVKIKNFKDINVIGIIINLEQQNIAGLSELIKNFEQLGKKVHTIGIDSTDQRISQESDIQTIITKKDLSVFANPHSEEIKELLTKGFEYIIILDTSNNYLVNYFAVKCNANCYIGYFYRPENKILTMQIAPRFGLEHIDFVHYIQLIGENNE